MKPALLLTLCLVTVLRAEEPLPGNPAEHGVPGTNTGPAAAGNGAPPDPAPVQAAPAPAPAGPATPRFQISPAEASPAQQQVTAQLPAYNPDAPKEAGRSGTPSPDAIVLPKLKVTPKQRPRLTPEIVITNKGLEQKAAPLDKLLNSSGLLGGASAAERAREEQERKKKAELAADVNAIARAVEVTDPAQAKALRDAVSKP